MRLFCEFSEYGYGYTATEEFMRLLSPGFPPEFPTLRQEATLGYDVWIAGFVFLQFKRPKVMSRRSADEMRNGVSLASPFYRMPLYTQSTPNQHDRLLALEGTVRPDGCIVSYACPAFHERATLTDVYYTRRVVTRSLLLPPSTIGNLNAGPHHVSYNMPDVAWVFSEPREVSPMSVNEILAGAESEKVRERYQNPQQIESLRQKILHAASSLGEEDSSSAEGPKAPEGVYGAVNVLRSTARRLFDVETIPLLRRSDR